MRNWVSVCLLIYAVTALSADMQGNHFREILQLANYFPHENLELTKNLKEDDDVKLYLYTRSISEVLVSSETDANLEHINVNDTLKFIIHGWTESPARPYFKHMTDEYLVRGEYNIVQVDWSKPASVDYSAAVRNTLGVGNKIGKFVAKLKQELDIPLQNVHILGHSLGAHVAGITAKQALKLTGQKVGRITGLDPAGPLYEGIIGSITRRLAKSDAEMVDVVHTDGGFFGYSEPIGTVDFFPNGGSGLQPGCSLLGQSSKNPAIFENARQYAFCSHMKSHEYFIKSINSKDIVATKCSSWLEFQANICSKGDAVAFGEDTPPTATGKYYFKIYS